MAADPYTLETDAFVARLSQKFYFAIGGRDRRQHAIIHNVTEDTMLLLPDRVSFTYWTFPGHDTPEWLRFGPLEQLEIDMMREEWWRVQEAIGRAV